jgi:putative redox protein
MKKKVSARRHEGYAHAITVRQHTLVVDEPPKLGGADTGPTPQELLAASLASCTAITIEMYADRKGWDVGPLEVDVEYEQDPDGQCSRFEVLMKVPAAMSQEQVDRLEEIATKCPVHRTLAGDVSIVDRVEQV